MGPPRCAVGVAVLAVFVLGGCAGTGPQPMRRATDASTHAGVHAFGPSYESLRRSAGRPAAPRPDAPPPPGLDPLLATVLVPGTPEGDRARESLDAALAALREDRVPPRQFPPVSPQDHEAAVRRYVIGREKLLAADARGAAEDLRAATRLDPGAPEPWRELAESQLLLGSPSEAAVSMQAAYERGVREARVLEFLGRQAEDREEFERGATWFARAETLDLRGEDPALPLVVRVALGRCLIKTGRLQAGRQALAAALELGGRLPTPTRYAQEVASIYRRQGEFWREVGDADCRLGDYERALEAYARAATLPSVETTDLAPRVFFAATRAGRPAAAAVFVLDRVADAGGLVTRDDMRLLSIISADRAVARQLSEALSAYRSALPADSPPSVIGSLERARAAGLPAEDRARVLRRHLAAFPGDAPAVVELLRGVPDPLDEVTRLAAAHPEHADRYADAMARGVPEAQAAAERLVLSGHDSGALVGVYLLVRIGAGEGAWKHADALRPSGSVRPEVEVVRARLAAGQGRWPQVERALGSLDQGRSDAAWARARALAAAGRAHDALRVLEPLLAQQGRPDVQVERLLLAAELAERGRQHDLAERRARQAAELDPADDRAYAVLLTLFSPGGSLPDQDKLAAALRDLRSSAPDSRLSAFIRAQEFVRRGFLQQAERELIALAEPDPSDPSVLELLSGVWTRMAPTADDPDFARVIGWLDAQSAVRPWADALIAAKARVMATAGKADEAEAMLRARLAERPTPETSHVLEVLLRDRRRAEEADLLAEARLSTPPVSIDEAMELAELRARQARDTDAASLLRVYIPDAYVLDANQVRRLLAMAAPIVGRARDNQDSRVAALWILDDLVHRGLKLPPESHVQRLALLAATPDASEERLLAAAEDAARDYPQIGPGAYLQLSHDLEKGGRAGAALAMIERAASSDRPSPDLLAEWLRLVGEAGNGSDARRAIDRTAAAGQAAPLVARAIPEGANTPAASKDPRAVLAFILAGSASQVGRDEAAEEMYELCLEYDPEHAWAANNLGYSLLERGADLNKCERLLVMAHAARPQAASILDSIGWLRYKQGILEDEVDGGRTTREGAVSLLERAVTANRTENPQSGGNATILDHCGDALWAAGRREQARERWMAARQSAEAEVALLRNRLRERADAPDAAAERRLLDVALREANELRLATRRKARAAEQGQEPAIAPRSGAPTPPGE